MMDIHPRALKPHCVIQVPGSKSYTHRTLIAAALSDGPCRVLNPLQSEDTRLTLEALQQMGVAADNLGKTIALRGCGGRLGPSDKPIHLENSGTSMRLLGATVVLGSGFYTLTGSARMCQRPIQPLLDSLIQLGVEARSENGDGCPPVIIRGGGCRGGRTTVDCSVSSQYLSGLLLIAPCLARGMSIEVSGGPVSRPYVDLTLDILQTFGIAAQRSGYERFEVPGGQTYKAGDYQVEPDASQAGYFWAAGALSGTRVKVAGVTGASRQGDVALADLFGRMGCRVDHEPDGIAVQGNGDLAAIDVDMGNLPDMVPTLAVVAAFAKGTTIIRNVAHLRAKESDRLAAVCTELGKMGIQTRCSHDELAVIGGSPRGARIETYDDHRIAMSFAVAGLSVPGVTILGQDSVKKSFPDFWEVFAELTA